MKEVADSWYALPFSGRLPSCKRGRPGERSFLSCGIRSRDGWHCNKSGSRHHAARCPGNAEMEQTCEMIVADPLGVAKARCRLPNGLTCGAYLGYDFRGTPRGASGRKLKRLQGKRKMTNRGNSNSQTQAYRSQVKKYTNTRGGRKAVSHRFGTVRSDPH